jgi:hypothetical protein
LRAPNASVTTMWRALNQLDRRWIFLTMLLAVAAPLLSGFTSPAAPSPETRAVFDAIESLDSGSRIGLSIDYDPSSEAELHPMTIALIRHCCLKRHKMVFVTLWPTALPVIDRAVRQVIETEFADLGLVYGMDYVLLGYQPGEQIAIQVLANDIRKSKTRDDRGQSLDALPIMKEIRGLKDLDVLVDVSAGYPGAKEWVQYAGATTGLPIAAGSVGVQVPMLLPYLPKPLIGLIGALRGAVEYETALSETYPERFQSSGKGKRVPLANLGQRRMGPQLWAHLLIVALILLGNTLHVTTRRAGGRG